MANSNGWGDGSVNNNIGWGQGANNSTGWGKSHLNSWSGATDIDGGNPPVNSVAPALSGTAQEGQTLTCSTGTWSGSPTYTYQWKRDGNNITSATNSTYTLVTADVGTSIKCTVTATNFVGSATADSNTVTPTSSVDADAQAFITAASITDPTQQSAINQLVVDLKGYSIWTKMKTIYPYVGGSAASHSYNLKNTAQFQITWNGGVTHSVNGVLFGGVNGYGNTGYNLSVNNTANNISGGTYSRTNLVASGSFMGGLNASFDGLLITPKFTDNNTYYGTNDYVANGSGNFVTDTRGMFVVTRVNSSNKAIYRNGSQISTSGTTTNVSPNVNLFIGARNYNGIAQTFDNIEHAFDYVGELLTGAEIANLTTAVQAFQTTLGRQV